MSGTAVLCSGQGTQFPGMFDLLRDAPEAEAVFRAAAPFLEGKDPRDLVQKADRGLLHQNRIGQILCCTQALAAWAVLGPLIERPLVVAGYSIGELPAWSVAGVYAAPEILALAAQRAAAMDEATKEPSGLAAVRGLRRERLQKLCAEHHVYVAIVNGDDHFIVGGTTEALYSLVQAALREGAHDARMLAVEVPAHTPLMQQASECFRDILRKTSPQALSSDVRLLSGVDGAPVFRLEEGLDKLALQISHTVDWNACMAACRSANVTRVFELGPGNALTRMMQSAAPGVTIHALSEFQSLAGVRSWLQG